MAAQRIEANPRDIEAYLLEAQELFKAEKYAEARDLLDAGEKHGDDLLKKLRMWRRKCETHLKDAPPAAPAATADTPPPAAAATPEAAAKEEPAAAPAAKPKVEDVRLDWFQTASNVTVCFFIRMGQQIKGSTDHAEVTAEENKLTVAIKLKDGSTFNWTADPLYGSVLPGAVPNVKPMKVEIVMTKKSTGEHWEMLQGTPTLESFAAKPAAYPTSSKKGKDWTRYTVDEEEIKEEGQDALNKLLQDIYSQGDPTTRQAMNKSFVESGGTVLSTNWKEVGSKKVETQPPKGMEARKWNE